MAIRDGRSLEDNGLLKRSVEDQEKIGSFEWARYANGGFLWSMVEIIGNLTYKLGKRSFWSFLSDCRPISEACQNCGDAKWWLWFPASLSGNLPIEFQKLEMSSMPFEWVLPILESTLDWPMRARAIEWYTRAFSSKMLIRRTWFVKQWTVPRVKNPLWTSHHMQRNEGNLIA